jgi:hypothetical protein
MEWLRRHECGFVWRAVSVGVLEETVWPCSTANLVLDFSPVSSHLYDSFMRERQVRQVVLYSALEIG